MLRGMSTVSLFATDVAKARDWYAEILGIPAYFAMPNAESPQYVEFRVGPDQDELGIVSADYANPKPVPGVGPILYWHVADLQAAVDRLIEHGATAHAPIMQRGEGFATASVVDPFGNVLGVMTNPHWAGQH